MNYKKTQPWLIALLVLASIGMFSGAMVGQFVYGLKPCHLCVLQRWPHILVIFLGAAVMLNTRYMRVVLWCMSTVLLIGAFIGLFHVAVEHGWLETGCTAKYPAGMSVEQLRQAINNAPLVSCDQAMGYVFGLSLALWNAMLSLTGSFAGYYSLLKTRKSKR